MAQAATKGLQSGSVIAAVPGPVGLAFLSQENEPCDWMSPQPIVRIPAGI